MLSSNINIDVCLILKYADNLSSKKYASYTVFKGKAALSIQPILPSFSKLEVSFFLDLTVFWAYIVFPPHHNFSVLLVRRISSEQKWINHVDLLSCCWTKEV